MSHTVKNVQKNIKYKNQTRKVIIHLQPICAWHILKTKKIIQHMKKQYIPQLQVEACQYGGSVISEKVKMTEDIKNKLLTL